MAGYAEEISAEELLNIPDPEADRINSATAVRRSNRRAKQREFFNPSPAGLFPGNVASNSGQNALANANTPESPRPRKRARVRAPSSAKLSDESTVPSPPSLANTSSASDPDATQEISQEEDSMSRSEEDLSTPPESTQLEDNLGHSSHAITATPDQLTVKLNVPKLASMFIRRNRKTVPSLGVLTVLEAESWSVPSRGSELTLIVKKAQSDGKISKSYDADAVRQIRGLFSVPPKCLCCVQSNSFCSRGYPCQECLVKGIECPRDVEEVEDARHMVAARNEERQILFVRGTPEKLHDNLLLRHHSSSSRNIYPSPEENIAEPIGRPPVWASHRQALCDTLPYYRAYESGCYIKDGLAYGFLLAHTTMARPYMDQDIVITRAGGGLMLQDGTMVQMKDHTEDQPNVASFIRNKIMKVPLILIVANTNATCPTRIPQPFCVMDYFQVTDVWVEKVRSSRAKTKNCYMFRFEKLHLDQTSWWAPKGSPDPPLPGDESIKPDVAHCIVCRKPSQRLYVEGWICLEKDCTAFWTIDGLEPPVTLNYTLEFIKKRSLWDHRIKPAFNLCPPLLAADSSTNAIVLSPRYLLDGHDAEYQGHALPADKFIAPVRESVRFTDNYRIHSYRIPECGVVTHFMANNTINKRQHGPDDLFSWLQTADIGLKRFSMKTSKVTNTHTNHFAVNYGMPYKYVVDVDSKGFDEAPRPIIRALRRMTWAGQESILDGSFQKFNELLAVGYFEEQKMGFHDDGEDTLGPTIATLSLGAPATMLLRMKKRPHSGGTGKIWELSRKPLPGCLEYEKRLALYEQSPTISSADVTKREDDLQAELTKNPRFLRCPPNVLSLRIKHGDIVIMHGADLQKSYEHSVIPDGHRFALTCRYVDPSLVAEHHRAKGIYTDYDEDAYDGDESSLSSAEPPQSSRAINEEQADATPQFPAIPMSPVDFNPGHRARGESAENYISPSDDHDLAALSQAAPSEAAEDVLSDSSGLTDFDEDLLAKEMLLLD
ncbi:MAG: hypothetical protein M1825_001304 [Sarcosagium campestre]|nr:MAG: hypothetical protein M1825_001304 [Sarcosagium campestre]